MEKPRVSAFAVYRTVSTETASKKRVKEKKKENGIHRFKKSKQSKGKQSSLNLNGRLLKECLIRPGLVQYKAKFRNHGEAKQECTSGIQQRSEGCMEGESLKIAKDKQAVVSEQMECTNQRTLVGPLLETLLAELGKIRNSRERAGKLFEWLVHPISPKKFFSEIWEKKPAVIRRHNPDYYKGLFSTLEFDRILRDDNVQFGENLDVTSYRNGKRETHNPQGRALPFAVWDFYKNGCSLRMLNPQAFSATLWNVLSILQEQFGSMAGANVYLTPAGTQGFAPHYDDIEAFVVQLEGKKHWRVYNPRTENEVLPQVSSPNFSQNEIGKPILEVVLEAGDLLYFPRGFIHQGDCLPSAHSLHITISSYQRSSWGDLMEKLLPAALQLAVEDDVEFRQGLPLDYLSYMGVQHSEKADVRRKEFIDKVKGLMRKLVDFAPVDAAVDQKAKDFLHDCLPPLLTKEEKSTSVYGAPTRWENGNIRDLKLHFMGKTKIRLLRQGIVRLCSEGEGVILYHTVHNSRVYHKEEPKSFEIESEQADAVEFLIHSYPKFVTVDSLPCDFLDDRVAIAKLLFEEGLIQTKEPLQSS